METTDQNNSSMIQGAGPSGTRQGLSGFNPQLLAAEMSLTQLGNFEPLEYRLDYHAVQSVIMQKYSNDWVPYLPRADRPNNRKALTLTTLEGWDHKSLPSLAEATQTLGRPVRETEFCNPTQLYNDCDQAFPGNLSLKEFLDDWQPLGRTFIVNSGIGGYFVPHRDHPGMPRPVFRLVAFLKNCGPLEYDWWMDDRKANIELGRVYYVNTRMTHRTISWTEDSWHLIINVPFTVANVDKLLKHLQHRH